MRILEVANADTIAEALDEDEYHVLHLSGHGNETGIELEDEDGAPIPTSAADLATALRTAGSVVPLVFCPRVAASAMPKDWRCRCTGWGFPG
ncbi:MAG: hypothetical protein ACRDTC_16325 [Pseudonocardiaceae bacterium]